MRDVSMELSLGTPPLATARLACSVAQAGGIVGSAGRLASPAPQAPVALEPELLLALDDVAALELPDGPVDDVRADELPVDDAPVEDAPVDDAPTDDVPLAWFDVLVSLDDRLDDIADVADVPDAPGPLDVLEPGSLPVLPHPTRRDAIAPIRALRQPESQTCLRIPSRCSARANRSFRGGAAA
jgi:hypothetical protein